MKKQYLFIILFYFLIKNIYAQSPNIQWEKSFGGTLDEKAFSICNTSEGGYSIAGSAESSDGDVSNNHSTIGFTSLDFWQIKLDSLGNLEWNKCFGGSANEVANSIKQTSDHGFILTGYANSLDGDVFGLHNFDNDFWVIKTDNIGIIQWQKCIGGTADDEAFDLVQTLDGGYFVIGKTTSIDFDAIGNNGAYDILVEKLNQNGVKEWSNVLGGSSWEEAYSCKQTNDGGYLIAGSTLSNDGDVSGIHGGQDVWVVKLDSSGQLIWQKCYGGTSNDFAYAILLCNDGGFMVSATTYSNDGDVVGMHGYNDFWLFKADSAGTIQWQKCYGGANFESSRSAVPTTDGGVVMIGQAGMDNGMVSGNHGLLDYWIVKVDSIGNFEWAKCMGGSVDDNATSVCETPDGGYIAVGYTESNDSDVTFNHGGRDYWVVKLAPLGLTVPELQNTIMDLNISQNNEQLNLRFFSKRNENAKMSLYDVTGKKIFEKSFSVTEGINYSQVYCGGIAEGMYFVEIDGERNSQREKIFIR